ncbi:DUF5020 family protein [Pleionea litopenaei]|uniref:DUF5020 family protein n=1 Tax=Pleionea litopenaei TaxID=3070815 RepID=A0AA51X659_9GAMM|nr:DUF5020 family protein [Pleionea sp. HL-JVS1]WMS86768.1 DUF5020 family protein [Pleionea sp. HL-JVS1]
MLIGRLNWVVVVTFLSFLSTDLFAKSLWSDNSLTYLSGKHYRVGDPKKTVLTFEHASGHSWGDVFYFVDRLKSNNGSNETYMEFSPRLSLSKVSGNEFKYGIVKDILIASTIEMGQNETTSFDHYLLGIGFDLDMPGFRFFQWNFYHRNNDHRDNNWQLTQAWSLPFSLGEELFRYDGFIDWSSATSDVGSSVNFTSQLKWDLGQTLWQQPHQMYLGFEYVLWRNKYGIRNSPLFDTNENNLNLLLKLHF